MITYSIQLDEAVSTFFAEIAMVVQRPVEEILADTLFKQVEIFCRGASVAADNENSS